MKVIRNTRNYAFLSKIRSEKETTTRFNRRKIIIIVMVFV